MPDALSKTVPIWCAVLNHVLFPEAKDALELHTPSQCVSESEHSQIEQRLGDFGRQLKVILLQICLSLY
jgi:tRNA A64-2'-O-ribosylphosphate transferase